MRYSYFIAATAIRGNSHYTISGVVENTFPINSAKLYNKLVPPHANKELDRVAKEHGIQPFHASEIKVTAFTPLGSFEEGE